MAGAATLDAGMIIAQMCADDAPQESMLYSGLKGNSGMPDLESMITDPAAFRAALTLTRDIMVNAQFPAATIDAKLSEFEVIWALAQGEVNQIAETKLGFAAIRNVRRMLDTRMTMHDAIVLAQSFMVLADMESEDANLLSELSEEGYALDPLTVGRG
jgi:hypothetical protein